MKNKLIIIVALFTAVLTGCHRGKEQIDFDYKIIDYDSKTLTYELTLKNTSEKDLILTDISGSNYTISNDILYIEFFSHDEEFDSPLYPDEFSLAENYYLLKADESKTFLRTIIFTGDHYNNFLELKKDIKHSNFMDIVFLIGIADKTDDIVSYVQFSYTQKITGLLDRMSFSNLSLNEKLNYLFEDRRFNYYEAEQEALSKMTIDSLNAGIKYSYWTYNTVEKYSNKDFDELIKYLIRIVNERDFVVDSMQDYSLEKVSIMMEGINAALRNPDCPITSDQIRQFLMLKVVFIDKILKNIENGNLSEADFNHYLFNCIGIQTYYKYQNDNPAFSKIDLINIIKQDLVDEINSHKL